VTGRHRITRRAFARLCTAAAGAGVAPALLAGDAESEKLQSEFLFDLLLDKGQTNNVGQNRYVVPVSGGSFEGPKLKGTVVGPSGDWMVGRADGSTLLDIRAVLQTDDAQKIQMTCRGIAYTPPGGTLYARILPLFETGAEKYAWLNTVASVGVFRQVPGKVAYRIYRIL